MAQRNGSGVPGTGPARSARRAILWGGVICGVLDISSAIIIALANGGSPVRMLQGIAGALLGPVTFQGGAATAALGLAMHFGVAFTATAVFYWLSRRFPVMVEWAVPSGLVFGVVWLLVMYLGRAPGSVTSSGLRLRAGRRRHGEPVSLSGPRPAPCSLGRAPGRVERPGLTGRWGLPCSPPAASCSCLSRRPERSLRPSGSSCRRSG
jgi:hypothetical protein